MKRSLLAARRRLDIEAFEMHVGSIGVLAFVVANIAGKQGRKQMYKQVCIIELSKRS